MTIKMPRNLMTAISVVAFAVMLHGCGGGGGSSPVTTAPDDTTDDTTMAGPMIAGATVPSGTTITLPAGVDIQDGTLRADMDETITVEDIGMFMCVSADGCSVDLTDGVITTSGDITVVSLDVTDPGILALLAAVLPPAPVELNELETVQADAATAATAAMDAAIAAKEASDAALAARENRAVIQTGDLSGGNSGMLAHSAYMQAKAAADEATAAQKASDAAAEATDVATATRALVMAEAARDNAVTAQGMAETQRDAAITSAANEVKIVDKTKTVGPVDDQTSITVGVDDTRTVTTADGAMTRTGKEDDIVVMSEVVAGIPLKEERRPAARRPVALAAMVDERGARARLHGAGMTGAIECRYYVPGSFGSRVLTPGSSELIASMDMASYLSAANAGTERVLIDGETYRQGLALRHGFRGRWEYLFEVTAVAGCSTSSSKIGMTLLA